MSPASPPGCPSPAKTAAACSGLSPCPPCAVMAVSGALSVVYAKQRPAVEMLKDLLFGNKLRGGVLIALLNHLLLTKWYVGAPKQGACIGTAVIIAVKGRAVRLNCSAARCQVPKRVSIDLAQRPPPYAARLQPLGPCNCTQAGPSHLLSLPLNGDHLNSHRATPATTGTDCSITAAVRHSNRHCRDHLSCWH